MFPLAITDPHEIPRWPGSVLVAVDVASHFDRSPVAAHTEALRTIGALASRPAVTSVRNVAYDELLAQRIRNAIGDHPGLSERKMFGGLAFLVDGHMAVVASGHGGLMVRLDRGEADRAVEAGRGQLGVMRGRAMRGWLLVEDDVLATPGDLGTWIDHSLAFVASLPHRK